MSAPRTEHSEAVVERRRYLDSDELEARMTAHLRRATQAAAQETTIGSGEPSIGADPGGAGKDGCC